MRLLQCHDHGGFNLTEFDEGAAPPYAILSHTWGAEDEEVTFDDLTGDIGHEKFGYGKIQFCGEQAARDGLAWFWIDTCCINRSNKAELSLAIRSMFRWYRNAMQCYVYLSDVSAAKRKAIDDISEFPWEPAFRISRWFTRGWTLQELLAPRSVAFFSREGKRLGDKHLLRQQIHEVTGVPISALEGTPPAQFSVDERLLWKSNRSTKLEEDGAYCLQGIFGVYMAPIYGEGSGAAFKRLLYEIGRLERCIQDLHLTDPRDDKKRIEEIKGGLLKDSYRWILENIEFQQWRDSEQSRLLWVKGDPGKGKTMLLCGVIDELRESVAKTTPLSYFFCQAADSRINNAVAVLRGLIYLLIIQQPSLVSNIRKKHDLAGKTLFDDANAWVALSDMFTDMLEDPNLDRAYLIIDALDECMTDLPRLLNFIVQKSYASSRVKWIVSSRNWPNVEQELMRAGNKAMLSLELNEHSISTAIALFIRHKVLRLARRRRYNKNTQKVVLQHLISNAQGTFLWAALVCQDLENVPKRNVIKKLDAFPPGLDPLYERMMQQVRNSEEIELLKQILALTLIVYRPITIRELLALLEQLDDTEDDLESIREIISQCGSFLVLRNDTLYFVHQSAKDFLCGKLSHELFPSGTESIHRTLFSRSLQAISPTLHRDMYDIRRPGYLVDEIKPPDPDPLATLRYSCVYWVYHLCDSGLSFTTKDPDSLRYIGAVDNFLEKKLLYWLEALGLCQSVSTGMTSMAKLAALVQERTDAPSSIALFQEAHRFITYHRWAIESSPLQAYASALLFSPARSLVRGLFKAEEPKSITISPDIEDDWKVCLQTLEGHCGAVSSVAFSYNSTLLASSFEDSTVKIWDMINKGKSLRTFKSHGGAVKFVTFSHDLSRLALSSDKTIEIWEMDSGGCMLALKGHSDEITSASFSHNSAQLASSSMDCTIKIWDLTDDGKCIETLKGHKGVINTVVFSYDSSRLASSSDNTIKIWSADSGECVQTLHSYGDEITSIAFSHDSRWLASSSKDSTVKIWDMTVGSKSFRTLEGHSSVVSSVTFSRDSTRLASSSWDKTIRIWSTDSGKCLQTLEGHRDAVICVSFSYDSAKLASSSWDTTTKIWNTDNDECLLTLGGHSGAISSLAYSHDSAQLASASWDKSVKIWDPRSGECLQTFEDYDNSICSVAFSHDSAKLALSAWDNTVRVLDLETNVCLHTLESYSGTVSCVSFSHDSARLASSSADTVKVWNTNSGKCLHTLVGHSKDVNFVVFSPDSSWLASASDDGTVKIWDVDSGVYQRTLEGHGGGTCSAVFSHDSARLFSSSADNTIKVWQVDNGICLQTLEGHGSWVSMIVLSYDSAWLASSSWDNTIKTWDTKNGKCRYTLKGHSGPVCYLALSHDSSQLASCSWDKTVKIWDMKSDKYSQKLEFEGHSGAVSFLAFSHDSAWLASSSEDNTVKIWQSDSGECLFTLKGHSSPVGLVAFAHDFSRLATSSDSIVKMWDMGSGGEYPQTSRALQGHSGQVICATFSYDSAARLVTSSEDGTVRIWDANDGMCLRTFEVGKVLYHLSFHMTGTTAYLKTSTGAIHLDLDLDPSRPQPEINLRLPETSGITVRDQESSSNDIALSEDAKWITHKSERHLWLPSEYRPSCWTTSGGKIGLGLESGRVYICSFDFTGDCHDGNKV